MARAVRSHCQRPLDVLSDLVHLARHSGLESRLSFQRRCQRQQKMGRRRCLDELAHALRSKSDGELQQDHDGLPGDKTQLREQRKNRLDIRLACGPRGAACEDRPGPDYAALKSLPRHPLMAFDTRVAVSAAFSY